MSETFHQLQIGGRNKSYCKCGKFLSVGKQGFPTNQKFAKQISQFMLKNNKKCFAFFIVLDTI